MEAVLIGTGGCTAYDVVHILKSRAAITDCVVEIEAERATEIWFYKIHFHFVVSSDQAAAGGARGPPVGGKSASIMLPRPRSHTTTRFEMEN